MLINIRKLLRYLHLLEINKTENTGKYVIPHGLFITHLKMLDMTNLLNGSVILFDLPVLIMNLDEFIALKMYIFRQVNHVVATLVF